MAELNKINTRIQLKYDSYNNWKTNNPELLAGEIAIAKLVDDVTITTNETTGAPVLFKVGPGKFNDLPWASALAADVHDWAKKSLDEFTAWVAKTPKTVTLSINGVDTNYSIEDAIKLVRNEITAGGEAAALTIADESVDGKIKYTAKQGGTEIVESIEINEGAGIEITVKNNVPEIAHQSKPTTGTALEAAEGTGRTYVTEVLVDDFGHIAGVKTATEVDQDLSNYKTKQTAITAADNDGTKTVKISQNKNGEISVKQVDIAFPTKVAGAETADKVANKLTIGSKEFDGSAAVEIKAADLGLESAMHFIGALSEAPADAKAGDVYLNTAIKKEYVYDTTNGWVELGDEGSYALRTVTITGADGLTGGGDLTTNRTIGIADSGVTTAKIADGNVTKAKLDATVQASLGKADSALQEHQDISGKADKVAGATDGNFAALDANGNLTDSGKKAADFQPAGNYKTIQEAVAETGAANKTLKISQNANGEISATPVDIAITHEQVSGLHEIATTGSIYDVAEGANTTATGNKEYLVFYCGTATDLID